MSKGSKKDISVSVQTLEKDMQILLTQDLCEFKITVSGDTGNLSLDMEDWVTNTRIMKIWDTLGEGRKNPAMPVFPELKTSVQKVKSAVKQIYKHRCIDLRISGLSKKRVIPIEILPELEKEDLEKLEQLVEELKGTLIEAQPIAQQKWLEKSMIPLINERYAHESEQEREHRIKRCEALFPSIDFIENQFGVRVEYTPLTSFTSALKMIASAKEELAKKKVAESEIAKAEAEIAIAEEKVKQAQSETRVADEMLRQKLKEQDEAIKLAIKQKIEEVRDRLTYQLHEMLTSVFQKDYCAATMPPKFKRDLDALIKQAKIINEVDNSLGDILEQYKIASTNQDSLGRKIQIDQILTSLESQFHQQTEMVLSHHQESTSRASFLRLDL